MKTLGEAMQKQGSLLIDDCYLSVVEYQKVDVELLSRGFKGTPKEQHPLVVVEEQNHQIYHLD